MAKEIKFSTRGGLDIVNLTLGVEKLICIREGVCTVSVPDGDSAVILNENESGLLEDFRALVKRYSPENWPLGGMGLQRSVAIPVSNSSLRLGTWQRILFVELGTAPREVKVRVEFTES